MRFGIRILCALLLGLLVFSASATGNPAGGVVGGIPGAVIGAVVGGFTGGINGAIDGYFGDQDRSEDQIWKSNFVSGAVVGAMSGGSAAYSLTRTVETTAMRSVAGAGGRGAGNVRSVGNLPLGEEPYQLKLFPDEAYNRVAQYGRTPTVAQRASVPAGMEFDHNPTLVQHYYEGAGNGGLPGFNLTQTERLNFARSLSSGGAATPAQQRAQGAAAAAYSKMQQGLWGLKS